MCFRWLKTLYRCLRRNRSRRNRGYSREISLSPRRFCSGALSNHRGRASFSWGREGSVTFGRPSPSCPVPAAPYSISGGFSCDIDGSVVVTSGDGGVTSGWDATVGTVPVYGRGVGMGYGGEGLGGPEYHGGDLGIAEGGGAARYGGHGGYGYGEPLGDTLTTGGVAEGSGYSGTGLGYGTGTFPGAELSPAGGKCAQVVQQKRPVVVPPIQTQQCKQSTHWPPVQKK